MLAVDERSRRKTWGVIRQRLNGLPQNVGLGPSVIMDASENWWKGVVTLKKKEVQEIIATLQCINREKHDLTY